MSDYIVTYTSLALLADSIRAKSGKTGSLEFPYGMKSAIDSIDIGLPFVLMGDWQFNESVTIGSEEQGFGTQNFKFYGTFNNTAYAGADASFVASGYMWSLAVDGTTKYLYGGGANYWDSLSNRVVGFGDKPQEVSKEFYIWFTANATTLYEADFSKGYDDSTCSLWGVWRLNSLMRWAMETGIYQHNFKFYGYVDGVYKDGVDAHFYDTVSEAVYLYVEGSPVWGYYNGSVTTNKLTDSIVGFGLTPQTLNSDFYNAFKSCATKIF